MFLFCLVFAMFCACLFICASWSPAGKGLTSWLSFVVSSVSLSLSHWYPGSGVVLDCIDSWSLQPYLLCNSALSGYTISIISFYPKLTFPISVHLCFPLLCWSMFWSICSRHYQNMVKKALPQVSVNHSSGHLVTIVSYMQLSWIKYLENIVSLFTTSGSYIILIFSPKLAEISLFCTK